MTAFELADFPGQSYDKLRFGDTDRQGHVNNVVFARLFETGRVEVLHDLPLKPGHSFVAAKTMVEFLLEIHWPGTVEIGTGFTALGKSSLSFKQALFQNGKCVGTSSSVLVHVNAATRRSSPLDDQVRQILSRFLLPAA